MREQWQDVAADYEVYLCRIGNAIYDEHAGDDETEAPQRVQELLMNKAPQGTFKLLFNLRCSGYHWPATRSSPEEGDDCRELESACLYTIPGDEKVELTPGTQRALYDYYEEAIHEEALDI